MTAALRQAVAEMNKDQPLYDVRTMESLVARTPTTRTSAEPSKKVRCYWRRTK